MATPVPRAALPSLSRNIGFNVAGSLTYTACQWAVLVLVAKLGTPAMVGQLSLGFAITAPAVLFANLQLSTVLATDARQEFAFGEYFALRLITTGLALPAIAVVAFASRLQAETLAIVLMIGAGKSFEAISDILNGVVQQHERLDRLGVSNALKGITSVAAVGLALLWTRSLVYAAVALAAVWLGVLLTYDVRSARLVRAQAGAGSGLKPQFRGVRLIRLARLAFPLGFVILLISLNGNMGRYFVQTYLGERQLGYFSAMAYPMVAISGISSILGASAAPRLSKYLARGATSSYCRLVAQLVAAGALFGGGAMAAAAIAGDRILAILYRPEYAAHSEVFVWLMASAALASVASVLNYALNAARSFLAQVPLFLLVTLSLSSACALMVPNGGLLGAARAQAIGMGVQAIATLALILRVLARPRQAQILGPALKGAAEPVWRP